MSHVKADPGQPRQEFSPEELDTLEKSIAGQGILQPLILEKISGTSDFLIVDGERRFRVATRLALTTVPAEILEPMTDIERFVRRFHIQEQHRPWTYLDKARAIKFMIEEGKMNGRDAATALGLSPSTVSTLLRILQFSKRIQEVAEKRRLPWSYLMDVHRSSREVDNPKIAAKLEEALFEKLESGTVRKGEDLRDYRRAIQKGGAKIVENIITNPDYTARQAMAESKAGAWKTYEQVRSYASYLEGVLNKATVDGAYQQMPDTHVQNYRRLLGKIEQFLKLSGHIV